MSLLAAWHSIIARAFVILRPKTDTGSHGMRSFPSTKNDNSHFILDVSTPLEISGGPQGVSFPRWQYPNHCLDKRYALVLAVGERLELAQAFLVEHDTRVFLRFTSALPSVHSGGLVCELSVRQKGHTNWTKVADMVLQEGAQTADWRVVEIDLSWLAEESISLSLRCLSGEGHEPTSDWIAISDLCVAREDELPLIMAKSFHKLRTKNEMAHFSAAYRHTIYMDVQNAQSKAAKGDARFVRRLTPTIHPDDQAQPPEISVQLEPRAGEQTYDFATRLLCAQLRQRPPQFEHRLKTRAEQGESIRVLSLCSGAARIEASFAAQVPENIEWSLLDINADLLDMASRQFPSTMSIDLIEADANELRYSGEKWDLILCVSALHHLVELENVMEFISRSLKDDGEFWSIGEYIGRNGNRLWPEAKAFADTIFSNLPEKYRLNAHTKSLDNTLPNNDYSVGCFEGIRSEDIEPLLNRWFHPVEVYRRNCFLWRLTNLAYSDNYDISNPADQDLIKGFVQAEVHHTRQGGRSTELFGIYRPRRM